MSFLVFQLKVEPHKGSKPSVTSGIKVRCHHYVSQGIVVCLYQERLIGQVLFEMFCNHPLQCQKLKLSQMIILLMRHKGSAAIGDWVILSVHLLLGQHCPESILECICLQQKWFGIVSKANTGAIMHTCFNVSKAFKASSESDTHSDFLLAPSPVKWSLSGCAIHVKPFTYLL